MSNPSDKIEAIIQQHGKQLEKERPILTLRDIEERLDSLEVILEGAGQTSELVISFNLYLSDLRREVVSVRRIRFWLIVLSIAFIVGTNFSVYFLMFHHGALFGISDYYFKSAVFIGMLTASVVLLSIMLKGAFHSLAERHKEEMIPPHLKEVMEAAKTVLGK